jgi:hypothetical protein
VQKPGQPQRRSGPGMVLRGYEVKNPEQACKWRASCPHSNYQLPQAIPRPPCAKCRTTMMLARIAHHGQGYERTFECPSCDQTEKEITKFIPIAESVAMAEYPISGKLRTAFLERFVSTMIGGVNLSQKFSPAGNLQGTLITAVCALSDVSMTKCRIRNLPISRPMIRPNAIGGGGRASFWPSS